MMRPVRHLLRARDFADRRYAEAIAVADLASVAGASRAHFSREFKRAFGVSPHQYLRARRLERAAALLRNTDWTITDTCHAVGWASIGSFTTAFTETYGLNPTAYRASFPPASRHIRVPSCVARAYGTAQRSTFGEADGQPVP